MASWNHELEHVVDHFGEQMASCGPVRKWRVTMHTRGINHVCDPRSGGSTIEGISGIYYKGQVWIRGIKAKATENKNDQGPISGLAELINCCLFQ